MTNMNVITIYHIERHADNREHNRSPYHQRNDQRERNRITALSVNQPVCRSNRPRSTVRRCRRSPAEFRRGSAPKEWSRSNPGVSFNTPAERGPCIIAKVSLTEFRCLPPSGIEASCRWERSDHSMFRPQILISRYQQDGVPARRARRETEHPSPAWQAQSVGESKAAPRVQEHRGHCVRYVLRSEPIDKRSDAIPPAFHDARRRFRVQGRKRPPRPVKRIIIGC